MVQGPVPGQLHTHKGHTGTVPEGPGSCQDLALAVGGHSPRNAQEGATLFASVKLVTWNVNSLRARLPLARAYRKGSGPSDHAPLFATLDDPG